MQLQQRHIIPKNHDGCNRRSNPAWSISLHGCALRPAQREPSGGHLRFLCFCQLLFELQQLIYCTLGSSCQLSTCLVCCCSLQEADSTAHRRKGLLARSPSGAEQTVPLLKGCDRAASSLKLPLLVLLQHAGTQLKTLHVVKLRHHMKHPPSGLRNEHLLQSHTH